MKPWQYVVAGAIASQGLVLFIEVDERTRLYREAVALTESVGKPMLLVGMPRPGAGQTPCSPDITLDIDPEVTQICGTGGVVSDIQAIPYPDGYFGAVAAFHVLEHLPDLESAQYAWKELWRVTTTCVLVAYPRRWNFYAAYLQPEHHLWVEPNGDWLHVEEREGLQRAAWIRRDGTAMLGPIAASLPGPSGRT